MLIFFRRIRKGLLGIGATSKYILYAIGEITLVVIGILIALQINNWNENIKLRTKEKLVLYELEKNLGSNINMLEIKIKRELVIINNIDSIIQLIKGRSSIDKDTLYLFLERIRRLGQVEYSDAAFQSLKTFGFDLIRSDSLRFELINLFDNEYEHHKNLNNAADLARYNALNNYYDQYFSYEDNGIVPNDYYTVINDQTFYNKLTLRKDWKKYVVSICNSIMEQSKNLKSHIHDELKLINK